MRFVPPTSRCVTRRCVQGFATIGKPLNTDHCRRVCNHPFGFGEYEDLTLYLIAALNGVIWGTAFWIVTARLTRRRHIQRAQLEA